MKDVHNPVIDKFESQLVDFMIDRSSLRLQQLIADGTQLLIARVHSYVCMFCVQLLPLGSFGKVYKGTYKKDDEVIHVAIKLLKGV